MAAFTALIGRPYCRSNMAMLSIWTTFAAKGDPNGGLRQAWPEFGAETDRLLEFTNDGPVAKPVPFCPSAVL